MNKHEQKARGDKARQLLENSLLIEVLDRMDTTILNLWKTCENDKERERLWYTYQGQQTFKDALNLLVNNGRAADKEIKRMHQEKKSIF
jgi:hypothetical protein